MKLDKTMDNEKYKNYCVKEDPDMDLLKNEIVQYLKNNLKLSWEWRNGKYYLILKIDEEKITSVCFGEGY